MHKLIKFTTSSVDTGGIMFNYKRSDFVIEFGELSSEIQSLIMTNIFSPVKTWDCSILMNHKGMMLPETLQMSEADDNGQPIRLIDHVFKNIDYVPYKFGTQVVWVQRDGFLVFTAPSGQGKTYFAINNMEMLSNEFENILYINLELNENDVYNRFVTYGIKIPDNLWIRPYRSVELIREWAKNHGRCVFIIDNIDNLVGAGLDPFGAQLEFIKELDDFCKNEDHHALVLTQLVKDTSNQIIDKNGDISDAITYNSLSGVKQLSYQARSVLMSAWSEPSKQYKYKILKLGSGKKDGT